MIGQFILVFLKHCLLSCIFFFLLWVLSALYHLCAKVFLQFLLVYFLVGNFVKIKGLRINSSFIDWRFGNFVYYDITIWRLPENFVVIIVLRRGSTLCAGLSRNSRAIPVKGKGLMSSTKHLVHVWNPTSLVFSWHCFKETATRIWPLTSAWRHGWECLGLYLHSPYTWFAHGQMYLLCCCCCWWWCFCYYYYYYLYRLNLYYVSSFSGKLCDLLLSCYLHSMYV